MKKQTYDLEKRLLEYSVRIIKVVEQLPNTRAGKHVCRMLIILNRGEMVVHPPSNLFANLKTLTDRDRSTTRTASLIAASFRI